MQKKSEKIIFTLYLLGFLALALTLALLQPLANTPPLYGNPPDEHARYLIPQFICRYGLSFLGLVLTINSEITSLPVPDSPKINTVAPSNVAARRANSTT